MRWRRHFDYTRPARPKVRPLTPEERDQIVAALNEGIHRSPVLTAFALRVQCLRGRFYFEWRWDPDSAPEEWSTYGRITPLENPKRDLLLETPYGSNSWSKRATGSPAKLIQAVAGDTEGAFHGLGSLDKSLREAAKAGLERLPVTQVGRTEFVYTETGKRCSVEEVLYHYFGLPIHVVARPSGWYSCHRKPSIAEVSPDHTRVLVRFTATSWSGEAFGATCLYAKREEKWGAYTIKPNQSGNLATAEAWLVKRDWRGWL